MRDESDRNGLRVVVDMKKDANAQVILNYLYKNTDLQVSYNYNVVAIVDKRPVQMGLAPMLDAFIEHRREVIERRSRFDLKKKEDRCHILEGLIKAVSVLDEIIALIRASRTGGFQAPHHRCLCLQRCTGRGNRYHAAVSSVLHGYYAAA